MNVLFNITYDIINVLIIRNYLEVFYMSNERNSSGIQLSDSQWLENHHQAKKELRDNFVQKLAELNPTSIVDIGCGTGLWLSIFHEILPKNCKFIGIDIDTDSLKKSEQRAENWDRECEWINIDVNKNPEKIPSADLVILFNFSSYIKDLEYFFSMLKKERGFNRIALRQFAGHEIKFGPFSIDDHTAIDLSIKDSIGMSQEINYFDMDRLIECASKSNYNIEYQEFELFQEFSPFNSTVWPYIKGTADWTLDRLPNSRKKLVSEWILKAERKEDLLYFYSLDWTALLS